jgi:hypothetical protein
MVLSIRCKKRLGGIVNRARTNYLVDVGIGIAGLLSAISGLIFLLPGDPTTGILGVSYQAWSSLHTWSSLAAIAGVGVHTVLHWKWMVSMTKQMLCPAGQRQVREGAPAAAYGNGASGGLSRRAFLVLGGAAAVFGGALIAGLKAISANAEGNIAEASLSSSQLATTPQEGGVACPRGLVNDPYPGRCHFYVDSNGDGICDYSVPGSGNSVASSSLGGGFPGGARRRPGFGQP